MSAELKVRGVEELANRMSKLPLKVGRRVTGNAVRKGARITVKAAKDMSPVKSGEHKKSIKVKTTRVKYTRKYEFKATVSGDYKDNWLEYGTKSMPAKPHFRPAAHKTESQARKVIADEIWKQIEKVTG